MGEPSLFSHSSLLHILPLSSHCFSFKCEKKQFLAFIHPILVVRILNRLPTAQAESISSDHLKKPTQPGKRVQGFRVRVSGISMHDNYMLAIVLRIIQIYH
jgi:hypothetical protein